MNSLPSPEPLPDYCLRAIALWPRVDRAKLSRVRHNPGRVAALISRRTTLSRGAILELLGVARAKADEPARDH
jgi:hypothetical protein